MNRTDDHAEILRLKLQLAAFEALADELAGYLGWKGLTGHQTLSRLLADAAAAGKWKPGALAKGLDLTSAEIEQARRDAHGEFLDRARRLQTRHGRAPR